MCSVTEVNGKENPEVSYTNKYQKHVVFSDDYKWVSVDDKFRKYFKWYLGECAVNNFISNITGESKYYIDIIQKAFNKNR